MRSTSPDWPMAEADAPPARPSADRLRRRCLWGLAIAFPLAVILSGRNSFMEWWRASSLFEQRVPLAEIGRLAGAEWRVASLQRVADRADGSTVVLAELEATVRDPQALAQLPCRIALADDQGRRWLPSFITPSEINRLPALRNKPAATCSSAIATASEPGTALAIRESFAVPRDSFERLDLVLSLPAERPRYLRFARNP